MAAREVTLGLFLFVHSSIFSDRWQFAIVSDYNISEAAHKMTQRAIFLA